MQKGTKYIRTMRILITPKQFSSPYYFITTVKSVETCVTSDNPLQCRRVRTVLTLTYMKKLGFAPYATWPMEVELLLPP